MANKGNSYSIELKPAHLSWGDYRNTDSREPRSGEAYIPIPAKVARAYNIYNSNYKNTGLGYNKFKFKAVQEGFNGILKATGCQDAGDIYAKQFQGDGDLRLLGRWFNMWGAQPGSMVYIKWLSPTEIELDHN